MAQKAEKYKAEDEKHKNMVEAKNVLDNAYSIRNCVVYNIISLKLVEDGKNIEDAIDQASDGLNSNDPVKTDEVEDMLKERQSVSNTIIAKIDQGAGRLLDEVPLFVGSETAPAIGEIN
ncbi:PREDICTED: heat shock cognate 70 kDa protein 1-like [Populus euphratica]|uniref:Heat shock cognate 70 kDa protein 1-like n=1 Tax=Populus euphratica TaxID=75702 RepID=A0AAJ6XRE9_POPEU|nr:PREDICTED: heat shock cognate 70 kDa protein 1-like [Populus euphratica]